MTKETLVVGAGIIGVCSAIHLQMRGRQVVLVDRTTPGKATSYGNAGLIENKLVPYGFPQKIGMLLRYALNNQIDVRYQLSGLLKQMDFMARYWWHSKPKRYRAVVETYLPLFAHLHAEHSNLIHAAKAEHLVQKNGWVKLFRTARKRDAEFKEAERWSGLVGLEYNALDAAAIRSIEPHLHGAFSGAVHWVDPWSVLDPHALTTAYYNYFRSIGGRFVIGNATSLAHSGSGWRIRTDDGPIEGEEALLALGPWTDTVTRRLGYKYPLGTKRGYHMHYSAAGDAVLNNWVLDAEAGYFLAPMSRGIRLTTGVEFALRDKPKSPIQLDRAEAAARKIFPIEHRLDPEPWMGSRPCTPDMKPIIGRSPHHDNLWFSFGHAHSGLTLSALSGRLIGEMMTGEKPLLDETPFSPSRFKA
ncbi:NAD(P)/FAD-dependent oxidoreductase [Ensifer sp. 4252]|uniref:NAD(P)/FAD-dependent oxidoreductase n=1 Tax=Ensifer sp. 4252 TaxID=3373915 RepID=UPI003D1D1FCB